MIRILGESSCAHGIFGAADPPERAYFTTRWVVCVNAGLAGVWRGCWSAVDSELSGVEQIESARG